jgi:hypothetical protein
MNKFRLTVNVLAIVIFTFAFASLAQAQASRTWVSGVGDDANPCSRTAPCKTFAGAISKTATNGEINCLDPGGFGAVTITKAISIICDGVIGGVLAAGTNGIIVNVPSASDKVYLEGLDIEGFATGLNGVHIIQGRVTIRKCSIRNFRSAAPNGNGVNLVGTATDAAGSRAYIIDSLISSNNGGVAAGGTLGVFGTLVNTIVDSNTAFAVQVTNAANKITLKSSSLTGSPAAINVVTGGLVASIGTSNFLTGTGSPTSTVPLQ